jgi:hypothetical protein
LGIKSDAWGFCHHAASGGPKMRKPIRLRSMIVKKEKVIGHVQPNPALQGRHSEQLAADFADSPSPGES